MKTRVGGVPRLLNVEPSHDRHEDWPAHKDGRLTDKPPPAACDLREGRPWYRVRDQGQTGSCVGWALADSVMRWQLVEAGRLPPSERLSPRFVWMASKEYRAQRLLPTEWRPSTFLEEAATTAKDALEVVRRYGVVTNRALSWTGSLNRGPVEEFFERAAEYRIAAYYTLDGDDRELHWRQWLDQHGPVLTVIDVDRRFASGAERLERFTPRRHAFKHACALVGYDRDGFIIRNSWGRRWGAGGDAVATPEWLAEGARETYGVVF
jgi:hypothetical protein